jgi:hypothetical protein
MGLLLASLLIIISVPLLMYHINGGGFDSDRRVIWWLSGCPSDSTLALLRGSRKKPHAVLAMVDRLRAESDRRALRSLNILTWCFVYFIVPWSYYYRVFAPSFFYGSLAILSQVSETDMNFFRTVSWASLFFPTYNFATSAMDANAPTNSMLSLVCGFFLGITVRTIVNAACHMRFTHHVFQVLYTCICLIGVTFVVPAMSEHAYADVVRIYICMHTLISSSCMLKHCHTYELEEMRRFKRCERYYHRATTTAPRLQGAGEKMPT